MAAPLGFLASLGFAVWVLAPRFGVSSPAPIDDWSGAGSPNRSIGQLLRPFVETPHERFRPGFDLFDNAMWHTFGAPGMTGPNIWNFVRVALFAAAVGLVPALVARAAWPRLRALTLFSLAALPPLLILATPGVVTDFARLEPQEPMLVGATVCGAALMLLGAHWLVTGGGSRRAALAVVAGWPLFVLGLYFKEASVAYLAIVPFAYLHLARTWRESGRIRSWREPLRDWRVLLVGGLLLIPLLWAVYRVAGIGGQGADFYGAGSPHGLSEWVHRLRMATRDQWNNFTGTVGTPLWRGLAVGLPFLIVAVWLDRRRAPWLSIGFVLAGWLMLPIQGLPGLVVSRYYISTIAVFAIAAVLALAAGRTWLRVVALVTAAIFVVTNAGAAHTAVRVWASDQKKTSKFMASMARLEEQGCVLHMAGLDLEHSDSLPTLVGLQTRYIGRGPCPLGSGALVVTPAGAVPMTPAANTGIWAVCRSRWDVPVGSGYWVLARCDKPVKSTPDGSTAAVLHANLLVPGVWGPRRAECLAANRGAVCDKPHLDRNQPWPPAPG